MCTREIVIDSSVHGLEDLTVRVLQLAVRKGFIPESDYVSDCARIVSTGTAPDPAQYHDQGELFDKAVEYLDDTCEDGNHMALDNNSLYEVTECDIPEHCDYSLFT